ncbi:MAG: ADP-ribosylglycohydrolase family protein [Candidatus Pacebacteria bacterium]|nr:ADP-ribosylglycohydrolase family protein [Candidatus Paceibacterota bacterium]MBP9749913.1 ADP-ribosylglycohydrolase family protein [Candidatus Paceibacterota bacterium]
MMPTLTDRYRGTLIGVHVGDSLGAPFERMGPETVARELAERRGLYLFDYKNPWPNEGNGDILPAGRPTDDSDQTADLAFSFGRVGSLSPGYLRECLRQSVIHGKSRLWSGQATGAGGTTRKALSDDPTVVREALTSTIGTNGSLMRAAPMGLFFGPGLWSMLDAERGFYARTMVWNMSMVTHTHRHSLDACWMYTRVLVTLLSGHISTGEAWATERPCSALETRIRSRLSDPYDHPHDPGAWPARGTAEFSLYVALYALMHSRSFAEGIEMAIRVGGDTDTYAAIAGGLLGARYGYSEIPEEWRVGILGHDPMIHFANMLYAFRMYR